MKDSTKYSVIQAAKIVGVERQTMYRHIASKPITTEKDRDGNQVIDASELIRVYGNNINFKAVEEGGDNKVTGKKLQNVTAGDSDPAADMDSVIQVVKLEARIETLKSQLEAKDNENDYVKSLLEEEKTERKKANNLLEDHRKEASRVDAWDKSLRAMEQRIANNEKAMKEESARFEKIRLQNKGLKRALEAQRNRSFFQRLFGLKEPARPRQKAV